MQNSLPCSVRLFAGVGLSALMPVAAMAQAATAAPAAADTSNQIAEIVVTAQKRSENSQNVPVAITSLSGAALVKGGVIDTGDLKLVTPGLSFNTNLGAFGQPRIRGIGSTATGVGLENPVATYVDGVYIGSAIGAILGLADVKQVDVLKGPQGTLFGRNATGGVVQVTTLDPTQELHATSNLSYGNFKTVSANGYVSGGLADNLAMSVSGTYSDQAKGYGVNLGTGDQIEKTRTAAGRVKLLWTPEPDTKVTLSADIANNKGSNPALHTVSNDAAFQNGPVPGGKYDVDLTTDPYVNATSGGASLTVKHDFGAVAVSTVTAWRKSFLHVNIDPDGGPRDELNVNQIQHEQQISEELQLNSTGHRRFQWVVGLFYMGYNGEVSPNDTSGPELCSFECASADASDYDKATLNSYAVFAQGTYRITDNTNLTIGGRYTVDQRTLTEWSTFDGFPSGTQFGAKTFPKPTWRIALDHRFSPELMVYATYNRGFKSGTFQPDTYPIQPLKVETVDAFEGGFKADLFDKRLRLNVSGFYYDYTNLQANQIIEGELYVYDAPGSINYGLDADLTARPFHNFQINAGVSWLHARYKNGFTDAFFATTAGAPYYGDYITSGGNASGNRLQDTPDFTGNIGASYDMPTAVGTFHASTNLYHNGGYYGDVQNRLYQKAYSLLDAAIGWSDAKDDLSVKVWGKNLTNAYYSLQYDPTNSGDNFVPAPPRTYGVTVGFKY